MEGYLAEIQLLATEVTAAATATMSSDSVGKYQQTFIDHVPATYADLKKENVQYFSNELWYNQSYNRARKTFMSDSRNKDLLEVILLDFLPMKDYINCRAVSKLFKEVVGDFAVEEYPCSYDLT